MNIDTLATILIALAPALVSILSIIGGVVKIVKSVKTIKPEVKEDLTNVIKEFEKTRQDIGDIKSRVSGIEKEFLDQKRKNRRQ